VVVRNDPALGKANSDPTGPSQKALCLSPGGFLGAVPRLCAIVTLPAGLQQLQTNAIGCSNPT